MKEKNKEKWQLIDTFLKVEHNFYIKSFSDNEKYNKNKKESYSIVTFSPRGKVVVVALTKKREIILTRQYRPAIEKEIINLPGGRIDKGYTAEEVARKELKEETGFVAKKFELIHEVFPDPARITDKTMIFLAQNIQKESEPNNLSPAEKGLKVLSVNLDNIVKLLLCKLERVKFKYLSPEEISGKVDYLEKSDIRDLTMIAALMLILKKTGDKNK